jgi:glycosyltransferase involved in cell wall biosynthesis
MPAYNEEAVIESAVEEVCREVLDRVPGSELLVVDDGSRDGTGMLLDALAALEPRLRVVHQPNAGHGPALGRGLREARGERLLLVDSDRQIPLAEFPRFWKALDEGGRDAAFGVRRERDDPRLRLWLTAAIRAALRALFGVRLRDANVPFKLLRREAWEAAQPLVPPDTLAPSLFLAVFLRARGFDLVELEVAHRARATGQGTLRHWRLFRFCARAFAQLLRLRARLRA